ncbi:MAG TPA: hypothetical protein VE871_01010 [Longimicrobium sp.]|nr:hypothetical protein [Longimicrobium sp.]
MKKLEALSLPAMVGLSTVVCGLVVPAAQWLSWTLAKDEPVPSMAMWLRFAAMTAVGGVFAGVAAYRLIRLPPGWGRSYLAGLLVSSLIFLDMDIFSDWPLGTFLVGWVLFTLVAGVALGGFFHFLEIIGQRRSAG